MDGLNRENNAFEGGLSHEQANQKPMARSVEMKLKKLRARLAKKELKEKALSIRHLPERDRSAG